MSDALEPIQKLTRDLRKAAFTLSKHEVRFLVDSYYQFQEHRKRSDNQVRALSASKEPHVVLDWLAENARGLENEIKKALDSYSRNDLIGRWARATKGIGPVITAGLLAHIDIEKAVTAGHIWRYAGLDPTVEWKKGQKRPWNADLKTLCWKVGESFVKVSGKDDAVYGKIYAKRKLLEIERNEAGKFEDQAVAKLKKHKIGKETEAYKHYIKGKLPPAHIHARARRYAVKLFLAHLQEVWFFDHHKKLAPLPYPIVHLEGHSDIIEAPNQDMIPGFEDARTQMHKAAS